MAIDESIHYGYRSCLYYLFCTALTETLLILSSLNLKSKLKLKNLNKLWKHKVVIIISQAFKRHLNILYKIIKV